VRMEYGHRNQQGAQGAVRARLSHRGLHQDRWGGGRAPRSIRGRPADRQRRQSGYVVGWRHSPAWGRQCSSRTARRGAERQRQKNSKGGGAEASAVARRAQPGDSGAG
jgi:hypothetical protein